MAGRTKQKLTMNRCLAFKPAGQSVLWDGGDGSVKGLGLRYSSKTGTRTFIFVGRLKDGTNREVYLNIGRVEEGWLLGAEDETRDPRVKAMEFRRLLAQGVHPVEQAEAERAKRQALGVTLRTIVALYHQKRNLSDSTIRDHLSHLERNFSDWADLPVASITKDMCQVRFTFITKTGKSGRGAPGQANLAMSYLQGWLTFARDENMNPVTGEYVLLPFNPVALMFKNQDKNEEIPRDRQISLDKIGTAWNVISPHLGSTKGDLMALLFFVAARSRQARTLRWADVDLEAKTLTLRRKTSKTGKKLKRDQILPINDVLVEALANRKPEDAQLTDYIFPSNLAKSGYSNAPRHLIAKVAEACGLYTLVKDAKGKERKKYELSPHDCRRSLMAIADAVGVSDDTARHMLSHSTGDVHFTSYSSRQGLADAASKVCAYVLEAAKVAAGKNVIPFAPKQKVAPLARASA